MIWILAGLALGVVVGFYIPFTYPANYSLYMSVAILATIDSIFGAVKSGLNGKYDNLIWIYRKCVISYNIDVYRG